jgi:Tfp pilus assembly protein PilF
MKAPYHIGQLVLAAFLLVALQFLVFGPTVNNEFLKYDDDVYVYENANIHALNAEHIAWMFARPYYRSYTPLTLLSHAVDYRLWGNTPWGHHLSNVVLHSLNALLVFLFGLMLLHGGPKPHEGETPAGSQTLLFVPDTATVMGAFVAAALFSLHPMRVESVAWVSDRKDLLLAFFVLPCCMAYLMYDTSRGTKRAVGWYLASLFFFVLAVLAKSIAIVMPLVLILFDVFLLRKHPSSTTWTALVLEKIPFLIVSIAFGVVAIIAARGSQLSDVVAKFSPIEVALLPFYSIMFYPAKILWPVHLTPVYAPPGVPLMTVATILCIGVTVCTIVAARRGSQWWLLTWLCYVVTISPTISGLSAGIQPWADRYSYLPTVSLMLLLGAGIRGLWKKCHERRVFVHGVIAALCLLLLVCGCLSLQQLPIWQNGEALWHHAIHEAPGLPMPYANLGVVLESKGNHDGALDLYAKAIALEPHYADALYNMGVAYESKHRADSAALFYAKAITADASYDDAYVNLGNLCVRAGKLDDAIKFFEQAIAINDADPDPYYNMGIAVYIKGDRVKALECFQGALKRSPGYAKAYHNMGVVYLDLGDSAAAVECFTRAARLGLTDSQKLLKSRGYSW